MRECSAQWRRRQVCRLLALGVGSVATSAYAGGGGQNLLLVVNPNDENSVRVAAAYQQIRNIPSSNILFIAGPTTSDGIPVTTPAYTNAWAQNYCSTIQNFITQKGLGNQIDYIGTLGEPHLVSGTGGMWGPV